MSFKPVLSLLPNYTRLEGSYLNPQIFLIFVGLDDDFASDFYTH